MAKIEDIRAGRYSWTEGGRLPIDPQVAGEAVEATRAAHGDERLPAALVAEARNPTHPLHRAFTWDDGKAAQLYRMHQARRVISSLRVVVEPGAEPAPAFVSLKVTTKAEAPPVHAYVAVQTALASEAGREAMLGEEVRRLRALLDRTNAFAEFEPLRRAAAEVERVVTRSVAQAAD